MPVPKLRRHRHRHQLIRLLQGTSWLALLQQLQRVTSCQHGAWRCSNQGPPGLDTHRKSLVARPARNGEVQDPGSRIQGPGLCLHLSSADAVPAQPLDSHKAADFPMPAFAFALASLALPSLLVRAALPPLAPEHRTSLSSSVFTGVIVSYGPSRLLTWGDHTELWKGDSGQDPATLDPFELSPAITQSSGHVLETEAIVRVDEWIKGVPAQPADATTTVRYRQSRLPSFMVGPTGQHQRPLKGVTYRFFVNGVGDMLEPNGASFGRQAVPGKISPDPASPFRSSSRLHPRFLRPHLWPQPSTTTTSTSPHHHNSSTRGAVVS